MRAIIPFVLLAAFAAPSMSFLLPSTGRRMAVQAAKAITTRSFVSSAAPVRFGWLIYTHMSLESEWLRTGAH